MTEKIRSRRKQKQNGAIAVMVTLILLILLSTAILFLPEEEKKIKQPAVTPIEAPTGTAKPVPAEYAVLGVVLDVNTEEKMITIYNVTAEEEQKLVYTGASTFFDGYGIQLTAAQLVKSGLYRFSIDTKEEWISTAQEAVDRREEPQNTDAWEKTGIDYMVITPDKIAFRDVNYRYSEKVCVMSNGKQITLEELQPTVDVVTIRGVGQVIYEIVVTKGHGYITLENEEDFIGGTIAIGSTRVDSISPDARYVVREGTYFVTVEHGKYTGTKELTVTRDGTTEFDVYEYGSGPIPKGWLTINIDPLGATLHINGKETTYTDGVELEYGTYKFEFSEGGYVTYKATVLIDQPKQSLSVYLTEQEPGKKPEEENNITEPDNNDETNYEAGNENNATQTNVSIRNMGYEIDFEHVIHIIEPVGAEVLLDGEFVGYVPISFENILGSCIITIIREDGSVKNFSHFGEREDYYYKFSWID